MIQKYYPNYSEVKLAELKYGLLGLYLMISKSIIIFSIAIFLGIFKELLIFTVIYNIIRAPSFGMHASKSWICLVASTSIFILLTYLSLNVTMCFTITCGFILLSIIFLLEQPPSRPRYSRHNP